MVIVPVRVLLIMGMMVLMVVVVMVMCPRVLGIFPYIMYPIMTVLFHIVMF